MEDYRVKILYSEKDKGFVATVPDLEGCSAFGTTRAKALHEISVVKDLWIESCLESGKPLPPVRYIPEQSEAIFLDDPKEKWQQVERGGNPYLKRAIIIFAISFVVVQIALTIEAVSDGDYYNPGARGVSTLLALIPVVCYFAYLWIKHNWLHR